MTTVPSTGAAALDIRALTVSYRDAPVLWDVDAQFPRGTLSAVIGPNGSGKSTLLRAAMGILPIDAGRISVLGRPPREGRALVAYVPQRDEVDWDFPITVREAVEMGRYARVGWLRRLRASDRRAAGDAMERLGLTPFADRQVGALSGGQRQRVFLARALCQQAELLVLDEPFAGIDARTERDILILLAELRDEHGASIIAVHHDLATLRAGFEWGLLLNVRTIACGPIAEVLSPGNLARAYGADALLTTGTEPAR